MTFKTGTWGPQAKERSRNRNDYFREYKKQRDSTKLSARFEVEKAIDRGDLSKQPCRDCGFIDGRVEAHHPDYTKPLEIIWLCPKHHRDEHKKTRKNEAL